MNGGYGPSTESNVREKTNKLSGNEHRHGSKVQRGVDGAHTIKAVAAGIFPFKMERLTQAGLAASCL